MSDKVAVLMGGMSAERDVSLRSGQCVLKSLIETGIQAIAIDPKVHPITALKKEGFTKVFNILHGRGGEDGTVQGLLEYQGLPYTGSGVLASALTMDKLKTKLIWSALDLPITNHQVLDKKTTINQATLIEEMGLPLIVKPIHEGSSVGMSKVFNISALSQALHSAFQYDDTILIENCLTGPEFTVSIVGDEVLPSVRIEPNTNFYDYQAKYESSETRYFCPGTDSLEQEDRLKSLALTAYQATGCRGWGRVDLMLDDQGNPYLLEVNTAPGMTSHSLVPVAAKAHGWTFSQLVCRILALARTDNCVI